MPTTNSADAGHRGQLLRYPTSGFPGCTDMPHSFSNFVPGTVDRRRPPDGKNLYVGTESAQRGRLRVRAQRRHSRSTPTPSAASIDRGGGRCTTFRQGNRIQSMAARPDSRHLYAAGDNRLFTFALDRPPVCQNVSAGTPNTTSVTVTLSCSDPDGDALTYEKVTDPTRGTLAGIRATRQLRPAARHERRRLVPVPRPRAGVASDPATASVNVAAPPPPAAAAVAATPPALHDPVRRRRASTRSGSRSTRSS